MPPMHHQTKHTHEHESNSNRDVITKQIHSVTQRHRYLTECICYTGGNCMQPTLVATPRELLSHTVMVRLDEDLLRCLDLLAIEMGGASRAQVMRSELLALAPQHRAELLRLGKRYGAAKPGAGVIRSEGKRDIAKAGELLRQVATPTGDILRRVPGIDAEVGGGAREELHQS